MSESAWRRTFAECFETPDRSHLVRAAVSFDFRHVAGGLQIVPPLVELIREAPHHPDFLARLARTATDFKPPLGFRRRLTDRFDVKREGTMPIANLARFHALTNGVTISATLDRLVAVEEIGALEPEAAEGLREAFSIVSRVRFEHHAAQIQSGRPPDNQPEDGKIVSRLRYGTRVAVSAKRGKWYEVKYDAKGNKGWVHRNALGL